MGTLLGNLAWEPASWEPLGTLLGHLALESLGTCCRELCLRTLGTLLENLANLFPGNLAWEPVPGNLAWKP